MISGERATIHYFSKTTSIGPSSRYRIYQYLPYLQSHGIQTHVYPLFGALYFAMLTWRPAWLRAFGKMVYTVPCFLQRILYLLAVKAGDLVVIEGQLFPYCAPIVERALRRRNRIILELDDAIYLTPGHARKIPALLRLAAGAIVGNSTLARYASLHTSNVYVVPTVVDTDRFRPLKNGKALVSCNGFRQCRDHGIEEFVAPISRTSRCSYPRFGNCKNTPQSSSASSALLHLFSPDSTWNFGRGAINEVQDLQTADIGVMPPLR